MTEYNVELCSPDGTTTRVLVKTTNVKWKVRKDLKLTKRGVAKSNQPSQGGTGVPVTGIFDNLKILESFTIIGYIDNKADAGGSVTRRETKRDNIRTLARNGQCFKLKWNDLNGTAKSFDVNVNGEMEFDWKATDTHRFGVTIPLTAGSNWGSG